MADFFPELLSEHIAFIKKQNVFFTASAPEQGRINLSPKGMNSFFCYSPSEVGYLDVVGSGNETAAHIKQNQRLTIMFCSFDKQPLIMRLYGKGRVVQPDDEKWSDYVSVFEDFSGTRQVILMDIENVQTSCGYGVPQMDFVAERPTLKNWAEKKSEKELVDYQIGHNTTSIDGLETGLHLKKAKDK
jgi:hypothetical protein